VTERLLEFPAPRSARLQVLARADTGFVSGMAYSALRGYGLTHPTVGELRTGYAELCVPYPFEGGQSIYVGEFLLTEVEVFAEADDKDRLKLAVGYGAVFGRTRTRPSPVPFWTGSWSRAERIPPRMKNSC
jgi:alpha-D-ribose 1-methylphosphonate 5-triphosphate synthase subunit PhnI